MYSIDEMNNKMTLYFRKKTGDIKQFATGINDMSIFGIEQEDYLLIWDYIVLDKDDFVLSNIDKFIVKNNQVMLKEAPTYPVA